MKTLIRFLSLLLISFTTLASIAKADSMINFESIAADSLFGPSSSFVTEEYRIDVGAENNAVVIGYPRTCGPLCPDNGTNHLHNVNSGRFPAISLTNVAGHEFTLTSFEAAEAFGGTSFNAAKIDVVGILAAGGIVTASFTLDGVGDGSGPLEDFQTFFLPASFTGLSAVLFNGSGGPIFGQNETWQQFFALDNILINGTSPPEPDRTPPVIHSITPNPRSLWPPNHRMVNVIVAVNATDNETTSPTCRISGWASSEPDNGLGDGDHPNDVGPVSASGLSISLRAERSGNGPGRIYMLTVTCSDAAGNKSTEMTAVTVPR